FTLPQLIQQDGQSDVGGGQAMAVLRLGREFGGELLPDVESLARGPFRLLTLPEVMKGVAQVVEGFRQAVEGIWHPVEVGGVAGEDRPRRFKISNGSLDLPHRSPYISQATICPAPAGFDIGVVALLRAELLKKREGALQQLLAQLVEVGALQVRVVGHRAQV